ncbi:hypothetical protein ACFVHB_35915 [Kitasatospora sp. NPDC127111]|uniref:hypothetical protein n=1 Tax=Kitasatospora sp. NPDC127111 TaxID=3345363 RepID=UPI00362B0D50
MAVAAAGSFPVGGPARDRREAAAIRHVRGQLVAAGPTDDAEIDAPLAAVHAGELDLTRAARKWRVGWACCRTRLSRRQRVR